MPGPGKRALVVSGDGNRVGEARDIREEKDGEVFGVFLLRDTAIIVRAIEDEGRRWRSVRAGVRGSLSVWGYDDSYGGRVDGTRRLQGRASIEEDDGGGRIRREG